MQIAPIPPYLVYDGFNDDLNAACVIKRVMSVNPAEKDAVKHLKSFLRSCLLAHNIGDEKLYVDSTAFSAALSVPVRVWAKQVFAKLFPTLTATTTTPPSAGTIPPGTDLAAIVAAITIENQTKASRNATTLESTKADDAKTISKNELTTILRMCGKASSGTTKDLPSWLQ